MSQSTKPDPATKTSSYITPEDAADLVDVHPTTVRRWLREARYQRLGKRIGGRWFVSREQLERLKSEGKVDASGFPILAPQDFEPLPDEDRYPNFQTAVQKGGFPLGRYDPDTDQWFPVHMQSLEDLAQTLVTTASEIPAHHLPPSILGRSLFDYAMRWIEAHMQQPNAASLLVHFLVEVFRLRDHASLPRYQQDILAGMVLEAEARLRHGG